MKRNSYEPLSGLQRSKRQNGFAERVPRPVIKSEDRKSIRVTDKMNLYPYPDVMEVLWELGRSRNVDAYGLMVSERGVSAGLHAWFDGHHLTGLKSVKGTLGINKQKRSQENRK
jgi:hypothetical protein